MISVGKYQNKMKYLPIVVVLVACEQRESILKHTHMWLLFLFV